MNAQKMERPTALDIVTAVAVNFLFLMPVVAVGAMFGFLISAVASVLFWDSWLPHAYYTGIGLAVIASGPFLRAIWRSVLRYEAEERAQKTRNTR